MVAKWMNHRWAGDGEALSRTILDRGRHGHVKRVVKSWLSGLVVVESGE